MSDESFLMPLLLGSGGHRIDGIDDPFVFPFWFDWIEKRAERNHSQSLTRLRDRGGLGYSEALAILNDRRWRSMTEPEIKEGFRIHQLMVKEGIGPQDLQNETHPYYGW